MRFVGIETFNLSDTAWYEAMPNRDSKGCTLGFRRENPVYMYLMYSNLLFLVNERLKFRTVRDSLGVGLLTLTVYIRC